MSPRKLIKRWMPDTQVIREHKHLRVFGGRLHDANLWHLNRHSVSGAVAVGLFAAYVPVPFEMVIAAFCAICFRVNLPIAVALVWISNPLTWVPMYGPAYLLGAWLLGTPSVSFGEMTIAVLMERLVPLWVGCLLFGVAFAALGYLTVQLFWRWKVGRDWTHRHAQRAKRKAKAGSDES
ncbi:MAG: DUF2062 domain-containing protein [Gammaproteobacteria bacterium]|nr:DUF2062 domain-containing protein [Gammaproteobacteria bacterium]